MDRPTSTAASPGTLSDRAYAAIRDRIVDGELAPGEFVREQELSDALGVSRTPVREGLGRLASEGLLERIAHRGFRVPERTIARLLDLYPIVSTLELLAGRLAFPHVEAADLRELEELNDGLEGAVEAGEVDEAMRCNEAFHELISDLAGNGQLSEMLADLRSRLRPLERWYYASREHGSQSVHEHASLIDALKTGQLDRALTIFEGNMALTLRSLREREAASESD